MNVIRISNVVKKCVLPILIFVDLQVEYTSEGRAHYMATAEPAIRNCHTLLQKARELRLPIGHFRQYQTGHFFNSASPFSHWVEGLSPRANEYVYERSLPSCFSSASFCELMNNIEQPEIIMAGLGGERACLSTAIECFHRGFQVTFVYDCSASAALDEMSEADSHDVVADIISIYGEVVALDEMLPRMERYNLLRVGK
jgi:nicotinamidase-related amidase